MPLLFVVGVGFSNDRLLSVTFVDNSTVVPGTGLLCGSCNDTLISRVSPASALAVPGVLSTLRLLVAGSTFPGTVSNDAVLRVLFGPVIVTSIVNPGFVALSSATAVPLTSVCVSRETNDTFASVAPAFPLVIP